MCRRESGCGSRPWPGGRGRVLEQPVQLGAGGLRAGLRTADRGPQRAGGVGGHRESPAQRAAGALAVGGVVAALGASPLAGQTTGGSCGPRKPAPVVPSSGRAAAPTTAERVPSANTSRCPSKAAVSSSVDRALRRGGLAPRVGVHQLGVGIERERHACARRRPCCVTRMPKSAPRRPPGTKSVRSSSRPAGAGSAIRT